jgi:hypothetical protein
VSFIVTFPLFTIVKLVDAHPNEEANRAFYKMTFIARTDFRHSFCRSVYNVCLGKLGDLVAGDVNAGAAAKNINPWANHDHESATAASGHRDDKLQHSWKSSPTSRFTGWEILNETLMSTTNVSNLVEVEVVVF